MADAATAVVASGTVTDVASTSDGEVSSSGTSDYTPLPGTEFGAADDGSLDVASWSEATVLKWLKAVGAPAATLSALEGEGIGGDVLLELLADPECVDELHMGAEAEALIRARIDMCR